MRWGARRHSLEWVERFGPEAVVRYEHELIERAAGLPAAIPRLRLLGNAADRAGVISFLIEGTPPEEIGRQLKPEGIAVRAGHHCARPILRRFGMESSVRPSLALYNGHADIDDQIAGCGGSSPGDR